MKRKRQITLKSDVRGLFLTVYEENFPDGVENVKRYVMDYDKKTGQVFFICHTGEFGEKDFFHPVEEKDHFHILIRFVNGKHKRVETILHELGIVFREVEDKNRVEHGEAICVPDDFMNCFMYLMHESASCKNKSRRYTLEDLTSNLTLEELGVVKDGYISPEKMKISDKEMEEIDRICFQWGYDLKNFSDLYDSFSYKIRKNAGMRVCKESYYRGIERRISDNAENHVLINRMNVYLWGGSNKGKTYACEDYFRKYYEVDGGGTGKFDKLKCSDNTIIINDDTCPNLMNMSDNKICQAYKRMKDNPYWCGENLIISGNLTFEEFIEGFSDDHKKALRNRFFVVYVGEDKKCYVQNTSKKCVNDVEMKERFLSFLNAIQKSIMEYEPKEKEDFWKDVLLYNCEEESFN